MKLKGIAKLFLPYERRYEKKSNAFPIHMGETLKITLTTLRGKKCKSKKWKIVYV